MTTQFDPYGIQPDWAGQGSGVISAWQRALAKYNLGKNNTLQQYGFNTGEGDFSGSGNLTDPAHHTGDAPGVVSQDGTWGSTNLAGGLQAVGNFSEFAGKDNKTGYGGFRDELNAESNALDRADNGPDRGFSGGLSNQAHAAAQNAVNASQNQFTSGYNQFVGNFNAAGQQSQGETNAGLTGILGDQATWGANEAMWQSSIPIDTGYTPGVSGGGSTPIGAKATAAAVGMAKSLGYGVNTNQLNKQKAVTFKGTAPPARGGHAL